MEEKKEIEKKPLIYSAIINVEKEIDPIGKNGENEKQHYAFRKLDDIMNGLNPLFAKYGIFVIPEVLEASREERNSAGGGKLIYSILKIKYNFYASDGSNVYAIVQGEGMDTGDKASNKAMSAGFKYACCQVFCIPTEDMPDSDKESPEIKGDEKKPAPIVPTTAPKKEPVSNKSFTPSAQTPVAAPKQAPKKYVNENDLKEIVALAVPHNLNDFVKEFLKTKNVEKVNFLSSEEAKELKNKILEEIKKQPVEVAKE